MRRTIFTSIFLLACVWAFSQEVKTDSLGFKIMEMRDGDTVYRLKQYYFVMLVKGGNDSIPEEELAEIQAGHLAHIRKMGRSGKVTIAGPFADKDEHRGILIFNVPSEEEVRHLVEADPAVKSGRLTYILHPWWAERGSRLE